MKSLSTSRVLQKQVTLNVPRHEWLALREAAARRGVPLTVLLREMLEPEYSRLTGPTSHDDAA